PINAVCLSLAQYGDSEDAVAGSMTRLRTDLKADLLEAIVHDVAARLCDAAVDVLPDRIEPILRCPPKLEIDSAKLAARLAVAKAVIPEEVVVEAENLVSRFLSEGCITHILN